MRFPISFQISEPSKDVSDASILSRERFQSNNSPPPPLPSETERENLENEEELLTPELEDKLVAALQRFLEDYLAYSECLAQVAEKLASTIPEEFTK
jgi:hypothetical protein